MSIGPDFDEQVARYLASLTHLHSANGHGLPVCQICRGGTGMQESTGKRWGICRRCWDQRNTPGIHPRELADFTGFIVYALEHANGSADQTLRDMYQYKLFSPGQSNGQVIPAAGQRVRALLYATLRDHLPALETMAGRIAVITHVPSTSTDPRRDRRALADAIDSAVSKLPGLAPHRELLAAGPRSPGQARVVDPARFLVTDPDQVAGRHVLLVEDTWVTGASVQSSAVSLHRAGAAHVTVLCVARMLAEKWQIGHYLTSRYSSFPPPSLSIPVF